MKDKIPSICSKIGEKTQETIKDISGTEQASEIVDMGADGTPTTMIDHIAENIAFEVLKDYNLRVISEESGKVVFGDPEYNVILDPIDGTYNSIRNVPFYTISIAFTEIDEVEDIIYGYVKNLSSGSEYTAKHKKGSFYNDQKIQIEETDKDEILVSGNQDKIKEKTSKKPDKKNKGGEKKKLHTRKLGCASLEICFIAQGCFDAFLEDLRIVDFAAAKLILEESGGKITNSEGNNLELKLQPDKKIEIIAGTKNIHKKLI